MYLDAPGCSCQTYNTLLSQRYQPAAVTYHLGAANHFVAFHKLGLDTRWHFYDGLEECHNPGRGDAVITETTFRKKLQTPVLATFLWPG